MPQHRILVVDDEEMIRDSLIEYLDENGYRAIGAVDGRDALTKLAAVDRRPCVILLDLMMPVMDGQTFRAKQLLDPELAAHPGHRPVGPPGRRPRWPTASTSPTTWPSRSSWTTCSASFTSTARAIDRDQVPRTC